MRKPAAIALVVVLFLGLRSGLAETPVVKTLFDPARYMRVSEVKPGMKGYGLSVFTGTKIEKFDVEVVDVVKNFNPKYDAILIRCPQDFLKETGPIAGMSGSPIYLYDAAGHARMAGAFAYGWPFAKECLAGVQPIEYMLALPSNDSASWPAGNSAGGPHRNSPDGPTPQSGGANRPAARWSLDQMPLRPWGNESKPVKSESGYRPMLGGRAIAMQPLATPLMAGGVNARALARIATIFAGTGLVPMQAGSGNGSASAAVNPQLEPGSVLAVPLLTGDMELTAVGTCTEKIGDRIFGFGHPFNDEGPIDLPMGSGSIAAVVANLETSFKLGFMSRTSGALLTDQTVGVSGRIGRSAPMAPMELRIVYDDGSMDETYHFSAAVHPKLTPLIAGAAVTMALTGEKILPQYHTVDYDLKADFDNGQTVHVLNSSVNGDGSEMVAEIALPLMAASDNPFEHVALSKLSGTIRVSDVARSAGILSVMVARTNYEPGETIKAYISYLPFHSEEAVLPVELELPHDLPDGNYQFIVSDWTRYLEDERAANPFKFNANDIGELFTVIRDVMGIRHDSVYMRLVRQADGVAVGHTAMPHLPASRRQLLLESGRSDITPFVTSTVKIVPSDFVMSGSAEFTITIEKRGRVEAPAAAKPENDQTGQKNDSNVKLPNEGK
jgi:hypothetical protein